MDIAAILNSTENNTVKINELADKRKLFSVSVPLKEREYLVLVGFVIECIHTHRSVSSVFGECVWLLWKVGIFSSYTLIAPSMPIYIHTTHAHIQTRARKHIFHSIHVTYIYRHTARMGFVYLPSLVHGCLESV